MEMLSALRAYVICLMIGMTLGIHGDEAIETDSETGGNSWTFLATSHITVDGTKLVATTGDEFVCATLDWWPEWKCNYGTCPWYNTSLLNLDLENPILELAVKALAPLKLRLGGTLQDVMVYEIDYSDKPCLPPYFDMSSNLAFHDGCLPIRRWDDLNRFFKKAGASIAFGLNVLYGRNAREGWNSSEASWNSSNAAKFISYTHHRGYPITAWELGNELLGSSGLTPNFYAKNMKVLHTIVNDVYQNDARKPLVVAPDSFYVAGQSSYPDFLAESDPNILDVVTRHIYNLGPGDTSTEELVNRIRNPNFSNGEQDNYADLERVLKDYPGVTAWVGESGGSYNSGHANITDSFIMAFWYLDQMGMAAKHNNKAFCRQTLIGGHYGLLDPVTYVPNPDFYGALLWQTLMGSGVLSVDLASTDIRAYAHCHKGSKEGDVAILILNYSNDTSYRVDVSLIGHTDQASSAQVKRKLAQESDIRQDQKKSQDPSSRMEYFMTPDGGDIHSHVVLLNGSPLLLTSKGKLPELNARVVDSSTPVMLDPLAYGFVVLPGVLADACISG